MNKLIDYKRRHKLTIDLNHLCFIEPYNETSFRSSTEIRDFYIYTSEGKRLLRFVRHVNFTSQTIVF